MATFNTAFGALPSVKTLSAQQPRLGVSGGRRRAEDTGDYAGNQQMQAQLQAQLGKTQQGGAGGALTFADMQKQGRARPAPGMSGAPQPAMIGQLQQMLAKPVTPVAAAPTPAPAPAPAPAPVPAASPAPAAAPAAAAPAPTGLAADVAKTLGVPAAAANVADAGAQNTYTDNEGTVWTRSGDTWTASEQVDASGFGTRRRVTTPVTTDPATGLPRMSVTGEVIGASLPERFYRDASGNTWVQRGGQWSMETPAGQSALSGYAALRPSALGADGSLSVGGGGLESFLRQYGRPETPDQMTRLAQASGLSAEQLQAYIGARNFPTAAEIADQNEESQYQRSANLIDPQTGYLGAGRVPDWAVFVPSRSGGPYYRAKTLAERQADYERNPGAFGNARPTAQSYAMYLQSQPDFAGAKARSGSDPAASGTGAVGTGDASGVTAGTAPRSTAQPEAPLPPLAQSNDFLDALKRIFGELQAGPTSQEQQAFEAQRQARRAELEAGFGAQRSQLEEELAARGLAASTIGSGRFGDLAGQQARALSTMEADILNKQAELAADRQKTLIAGLQAAGVTQSDINFRALQLQQEARLRGRELDIDEARAKAAEQLGLKTYGIQEDEMLVGLIRALGDNIPPDVLKRILARLGYDDVGEIDENVGGGVEDQNNPNTWKPGSIDGEVRKTADGREFRYNATQKKWLPVPGTNTNTGTNPTGTQL